jgi:hypothetical protein
VSDELIDAIAICGTPEHCREQLGEWRRHGVGLALMNLPTGAPFEMAEMLLRTFRSPSAYAWRCGHRAGRAPFPGNPVTVGPARPRISTL